MLQCLVEESFAVADPEEEDEPVQVGAEATGVVGGVAAGVPSVRLVQKGSQSVNVGLNL